MAEIKGNSAYNSARNSTYWQQLQMLAKQPWSLAAFFAQDDSRATRFSMQAGALYMDYSKQCIHEQVLAIVLQSPESCELSTRIECTRCKRAMVKYSEERAALHTALRLPKSAKLDVDGQNVVADVHDSLSQVARLSERTVSVVVHGAGFSGKAIFARMWSILALVAYDLGTTIATDALGLVGRYRH